MYLKNPDETYIRLDPVNESINSSNNNNSISSSSISDTYLQDIGDHQHSHSTSAPLNNNTSNAHHEEQQKIFAQDRPDS